VLRRIFGPKWEKVAGGWRRQHNEESFVTYVSSNVIRMIKSKRMRWVGHVAHVGEMRNSYNILVEKHDGKSPLGRPRRRQENNIRMDLREIGWKGVDWIHLVQDRDQ
jgi:hypothetical protein